MYPDITRYLKSSARVDTTGIDFDRAFEIGLSDDEIFVLNYFADVENQSLRYLRMLLGMKIAFEPEVSAFLAMWNYEEFFHGYELENLMRGCGAHVGRDRRQEKLKSSRLNEKIEQVLIPILSRLYEDEFPAVYLAFGAIQELTTLRGYESLVANTKNPGLKSLAERIAKQERRHFAWYFNAAESLLSSSPKARTLTRRMMKFNWVPVGAGIHTPEQVNRLFRILFYPRPDAAQVVCEIDDKLGTLPGLADLHLMQNYFTRQGVV